MALRFDITRLDDPRRDHNGYLIANARATRTGVFVYHHPDGSTTRELRHPDDIFKAESIASLKNRPITDGHPIEGRVTSENNRRLSVGMSVEEPKHDDRYIDTKIQITDEGVINRVLDGDAPLRELSCGYEAEIHKEDGTYQGDEYDHRQTNIRYNHIALVKRGRAGPQVRLQLDSADAAGDGLEYIVKADDDKLIVDFQETDKTIKIDVKGFKMFVPKSFRTVDIKGANGVQVLVGRLNKPHSGKAGSDTPQKYIFDKDKFSVSEAKAFVAKRRDSQELVKIKDIAQTTGSAKSNIRSDSNMLKIKRDAVNIRSFKMDSFQVEIEDTVESGEKAVELVIDRLDAAIAHIQKLEGEKDKLNGRIDGLKDQGKTSLAGLNDQVRERTDAIAAAHYLGLTDYNDMETEDLKKVVVCKAYPQVKIDELNKDHIEGRYDTIIEGMKIEGENLKSTLALKPSMGDAKGRFPVHTDDMSPRDQFLNDTKDMCMSEADRKLQA